MKLPFISRSSKPKTPSSTAFFVLRITPTQLQSALCLTTTTIKQSKATPEQATQILASSQFMNWDNQNSDSLITVTDESLSQIAPYLPGNVDEPSKVLFGIPAVWVSHGSPLPDYKELLKTLAGELDLQPLGFAVTSEAVINLLNQQESAPVTAVVITYDKQSLEVNLAFQGKVQQFEMAQRLSNSENAAVTSLEPALEKFPANQLPARIILFDGGEDLSSIHRQLSNYDWESADVGFLQIPKVDLLPNDLPIKSLVIAAGQTLSTAESHNPEPLAPVDSESESELDHETGSKPETGDIQEDEFSSDQTDDIVVEETDSDSGETHTENDELGVEGFIIGQDIKEVGMDSYDEEPEPNPVAYSTKKHSVPPTIVHQDNSNLASHTPLKINKPAKSYKFRLPWRLIIVGVVLILFIAGGIGVLLQMTTASLSLLVEPQLLENQITVSIDTQIDTADPENAKLPGQILTSQTSSAKSTSTTGKTTVGEKAKGEVTIFNDNDSARELTSGTKLTSSDGLVFTLDEAVQVASKSVDLSSDSPFKPGSARTSVTAAVIGSEYNLSANTSFTIANFSQTSLIAKNTEAFSGGSSKEIKAVAQSDIDKLLEELQAELETQALEKLNQQMKEGNQLITSSIDAKVVDQKYDHKAGDEADTVSLNLTLRFTAVSYSSAEFDKLVQDQLVSRVPSDKKLSDTISTDFQLQDSSTDTVYNFLVTTKSYLLTELSPDNIKQKIKGKTPEAVKDYLLSLPTVKQASHEIKPSLPQFLRRFPFDPEKIEITIVPEENK